MLTHKNIAVVGSREFKNYAQLKGVLDEVISPGDWIISGGAFGADSMGQRYAKESGHPILIFYPDWSLGRGAGLIRNEWIVENSDIVLAFYAKGRYQQGGTANSASWAKKLNKELREYEEQ